MNIVELTEYIIKKLVKDSESVSVKEFEGNDDEVVVQVIVSKDDMPALIGKSGTTANAVRTVIQAVAYANNLPRVKINIDSF